MRNTNTSEEINAEAIKIFQKVLPKRRKKLGMMTQAYNPSLNYRVRLCPAPSKIQGKQYLRRQGQIKELFILLSGRRNGIYQTA